MPEPTESTIPPAEVPGSERETSETAAPEPVIEPSQSVAPEPAVTTEAGQAADNSTEVWQSIEARPPVSSASSTRRRSLPVSVWFIALLVPYAIGATIAVAYLLQQQQRS